MPNIEGTILRRVLPIFIVMQQFNDERDNIYKSVINGLLEKYYDISENSSDIDVKLYFVKYTNVGFAETSELINIVSNTDDIICKNVIDGEISFNDILVKMTSRMSIHEYLKSDTGFYEPIIYFFVDGYSFNLENLKNIKKANKWYGKSTKLAFPLKVDSSNDIDELVDTHNAIFCISRDSITDEEISDFIDLIFGIRINSITHSVIVAANFCQTGNICAAMHDGIADSPDEYDESFAKIYEKQQQYRDLIHVDPIDDDEIDGPDIILTGAIDDTAEDTIIVPTTEITNESNNTDIDDWDDKDIWD